MKLTLLRLSGATLLTLFTSSLFSQIVSGNAFLQSDYVEMGINPSGVYISTVAPPAGYQPAPLGLLGIIADSDKDGWAVGTPGYCGDYFVPGSPEEGWVISANGTNYYNTYFGAPGVPGSVVNYNNNVTAVSGTWKGSITGLGLNITQITSIPHGGTLILGTIQIKNNSASIINGVYYTRNADPDNEQVATGDFTTNNIIVQNHPIDPWAWVSATGLTYGCYYAMASMQSNSRASYGGFSTASVLPNNCYSGVAPWSISGSSVADIAVQLTYKIGKINPGQTKVVTYVIGTNEDDIAAYIGFTGDEVVDRMEAQLNGGNNFEYNPEFTISPNPTSGTINLYGYGLNETSTVELQIVNMVGQIVATEQLNNTAGITSAAFELDASLQNGTYFANFIVDGKMYAQPFVLNR